VWGLKPERESNLFNSKSKNLPKIKVLRKKEMERKHLFSLGLKEEGDDLSIVIYESFESSLEALCLLLNLSHKINE
jgi:hypothetical protein